MSRLSSNRIRLVVEGDAVRGTLLRGWLRDTVVHEASHRLEAGATPDESMTMFDRALDSVLLELGKSVALAGLRLHVELADALVHVDVASGDFDGQSDAQLQAIASACVIELMGEEEAAAHELRWQLQSDGKHLLVCAIRRELAHALAKATERHALELASLQADFIVQWNRHARRALLDPGVFVVASRGDVVVACVQRGVIAGLSSGAWLAQDEDNGTQRGHVDRLISNLGLDQQTGTGPLDSRVDRLLASLGLDTAEQSSFVLVAPMAPDAPTTTLSPRWTVLPRELEAAA